MGAWLVAMSPGPSHANVHSDSRSRSASVPPIQDQGNPKPPVTVRTPDPTPEPLIPPCYVVTSRGDDTCERRPVSTAGQLHSVLSGLVGKGTQEAAAAPGVFATTTVPSVKQTRGMEGATRPLITIYGLPAAFVPVLLDSPLDIDPAFVEAHVAGRRYRPLGVRRRRGARTARHAHWDYPELVAGSWKALNQEESCSGSEKEPVGTRVPGGVIDPARQSVVLSVSGTDKGLAAVFCRASLWVGQDVDMLFLDKPGWGEKGPLRKARRAVCLMDNSASMSQEPRLKDDGTRGNVAVAQWRGEIPSLENTLQDSLATAGKDESNESRVFQLLEEVAYEQWLELFEVLTPRRGMAKAEGISLEWHIMRALERNFDMARCVSRSKALSEAEKSLSVSPDDWGGLTQRLRTRVEILATMSPCAVAHKKKGKTASGTPFHGESVITIPRRSRRGAEDDGPSSSSPQGGSDDNNQRALDRVTYLGGILLPFSLVSGVLSMNESFEPGQPLFWVFWAATIPLALFTVLVIYVDKLRQVEVWAEMLDPGGGSDSGSDDDDKGSRRSGSGEKVHETEKGGRKSTSGLGISRYGKRRQQPVPVTFSTGGDVVIDLGNPTAGIQQVSAGPLGPQGEDQPSSDSEQGEESTSSDEDTAGGVVLPMTAGGAGYRPGWRKKQLGWKGAAMCMLRIRKPLRVLDGMPVAAREGQHDD